MTAARAWDARRRNRAARLARARAVAPERWVASERVTALLEALLEPGDRLGLEGDTHKHAAFLPRARAGLPADAAFGPETPPPEG